MFSDLAVFFHYIQKGPNSKLQKQKHHFAKFLCRLSLFFPSDLLPCRSPTKIYIVSSGADGIPSRWCIGHPCPLPSSCYGVSPELKSWRSPRMMIRKNQGRFQFQIYLVWTTWRWVKKFGNESQGDSLPENKLNGGETVIKKTSLDDVMFFETVGLLASKDTCACRRCLTHHSLCNSALLPALPASPAAILG